MASPKLLVCATIVYTALCTASIHADSIRELQYQGPLAPANITPTFDKGYLIVYNPDRSIAVYGPDGLPRFSASPEIAGATYIAVQNAAANGAGRVAAAVEFQTTRGEHKVRTGGGLAFFDAAGRQTRFVDTGLYLPTQVASADDQSIWTVGYERKQAGGKLPEYFVLRNYSPDGQELGAFLPRSSFDPDFDPLLPSIGLWGLRVANGRIGALLYRATGKLTWMEIDNYGKELGRWTLDPNVAMVAFTSTGALYSKNDGKIKLLDRSGNSWRTTPAAAEGTLLGADGDELVFWKHDSSVLQWIAPSANPLPVN